MQQYSNNVPVDDRSTYGGQQTDMSRADAAIMGQDFRPQMPTSLGGMMQMASSPFSPFIKSFADQTRYGMSPASQSIFDGLDPTQRNNIGSMQDQVNYARNQVMQDQAAPNSDQQGNSMTQAPRGLGGGGGYGNNMPKPLQYDSTGMPILNMIDDMGDFVPPHLREADKQRRISNGEAPRTDYGPDTLEAYNVAHPENFQVMEDNNRRNAPPTQEERGSKGTGTGRDYQPTGGTFKPITFRSGTGNPDPYAGLSDMAHKGQGMFNVAGQDALQSADQFNYNFDPQQAGRDLFTERSSLLEPAFAQQRAQNLEQMQGLGRIGLQLSGEGLGAGKNSGMMNPDMFGMNAAQSQALAGLSAQSTQDAFGREVQRAGLDLNQFNTNQMTDQQRYANLMGTGQSMLTGSMIEPQMRAELLTQGRQQQALDQNYELGKYNADTARITGQAQANAANYQPDPWLSSLTSLGTSFLGTSGGSGWLSGVGGDIWDFFT